MQSDGRWRGGMRDAGCRQGWIGELVDRLERRAQRPTDRQGSMGHDGSPGAGCECERISLSFTKDFCPAALIPPPNHPSISPPPSHAHSSRAATEPNTLLLCCRSTGGNAAALVAAATAPLRRRHPRPVSLRPLVAGRARCRRSGKAPCYKTCVCAESYSATCPSAR